MGTVRPIAIAGVPLSDGGNSWIITAMDEVIPIWERLTTGEDRWIGVVDGGSGYASPLAQLASNLLALLEQDDEAMVIWDLQAIDDHSHVHVVLRRDTSIATRYHTEAINSAIPLIGGSSPGLEMLRGTVSSEFTITALRDFERHVAANASKTADLLAGSRRPVQEGRHHAPFRR